MKLTLKDLLAFRNVFNAISAVNRDTKLPVYGIGNAASLSLAFIERSARAFLEPFDDKQKEIQAPIYEASKANEEKLKGAKDEAEKNAIREEFSKFVDPLIEAVNAELNELVNKEVELPDTLKFSASAIKEGANSVTPEMFSVLIPFLKTD